MDRAPLFSSGLEVASVVLTSDLLSSSWEAILELCSESSPNEQPNLAFSVKHRIYERPSCTILAFASSPTCTKHHLQAEADLAPWSTLRDTCPHFNFLCTKANPSFSTHKAAVTLFASLDSELADLKTKAERSTRLIITGHSLGGSVASLFALWLLENTNSSKAKRPLCITFGSPLLGDNGFQKAVLERSTWNSCFLHVASEKDPVPRLFISPQTGAYKPFGTYLLCSESGNACLEEPESILELLVAMGSQFTGSQDPNRRSQSVNYGEIVRNHKSRVIRRGVSQLGERITDPLWAGIIVVLDTIGVGRAQPYLDVATLVRRAKDFVTQKKKVFDPSKKLNDVKINMAKLEWYKKDAKAKKIGYYDAYKNSVSRQDRDVIKYKTILRNYWKEMVAEAERRPQKEGASFRTRWLYAGTNFRRMVEPLEIADYYKCPGAKDYRTRGRSPHYILLEKWQRDEKKPADPANEPKMASSLTEDSCFWADVEEAIISCNFLNNVESSPEEKESSRKSLIEFEKHVMDLIRDYAVSPEIFLWQSSFMKWWKEYEKVIGADSNSPLLVYMRDEKYEQYA
ncbi:senescence-associated carboxylesterase 101 [Malania oleifera]|uniref:senescence-associated carboxylesterase 101 n=1 Tax=Malania oleifera TaxID=397392 RepID=UPI0025AE06AE|nr:senescence-associated carboxylesterase 101 [Malania oleifera]